MGAGKCCLRGYRTALGSMRLKASPSVRSGFSRVGEGPLLAYLVAVKVGSPRRAIIRQWSRDSRVRKKSEDRACHGLVRVTVAPCLRALNARPVPAWARTPTKLPPRPSCGLLARRGGSWPYRNATGFHSKVVQRDWKLNLSRGRSSPTSSRYP